MCSLEWLHYLFHLPAKQIPLESIETKVLVISWVCCPRAAGKWVKPSTRAVGTEAFQQWMYWCHCGAKVYSTLFPVGIHLNPNSALEKRKKEPLILSMLIVSVLYFLLLNFFLLSLNACLLNLTVKYFPDHLFFAIFSQLMGVFHWYFFLCSSRKHLFNSFTSAFSQLQCDVFHCSHSDASVVVKSELVGIHHLKLIIFITLLCIQVVVWSSNWS